MKSNNLYYPAPLRLKIFSEKLDPDIYEIPNKQTLIGSSHKCDIVLSDEGLSDYEILIGINSDGKHFIQSLSFSQDLIINGKKKKKTSLETGDLISFGVLEGIFESSSIPQLPKESIGNDYFKRDIVFEEDLISDITPLEECSFYYKETDERPIPKKSENLIHEQTARIPIVQIQYFSCGVLIFEEKRDFLKDEISIGSKGRSNNIWGPFFENDDEYSFLKKNKNGDIFFKDLPGFNGLTELTAKEGDTGGWKIMGPGENMHFYKGPNLMVVSLLRKEFNLASQPFFEFDKKEKKIFICSLMFVLFFLTLSFFIEKPKEMSIVKKEIMINFTDYETQLKKPSLSLPKKNIKPSQKKLSQKRAHKKIKNLSKKKKIAKDRSINKALDQFLKGPEMVRNKEKKISSKRRSFLEKIHNISKNKGSGKKIQNVSKKIKGMKSLKGMFIKDNKRELIKYNEKTVFLGAMSPELIRKILKKYLPQFKFCFQQDLAFEKTKKGGIVDLKFSISKFGKVKDISMGFKKKDFSVKGIHCMRKVLGLIKFPRPKGGGKVRVRQPLNFSTEKGALTL